LKSAKNKAPQQFLQSGGSFRAKRSGAPRTILVRLP
jgi:hypothetical protein